MASILPVGEKWRAQVRRSGQSIAKTFKTKGAAQAWAREQEVAIDKGRNAVDAETVTIGVLIEKYREARAESERPVKPKSNEDYVLQRLHDTFQSNLASRLTTQQIVQFAQARKRGVDGKPGAGGYTIEMDLSKLGTVMRHMASLLDIVLPDAIAAARPTLHHLRLIDSGNKRTRRPTPAEIKMFLTRIGEDCKVVVNGDVSQCDLDGASGLRTVLDLIKAHVMPIPVIEFSVDDIVRSHICAMWVKAFSSIAV